LYSYKIIGVCRAKNIRKAWSEGGYQPPYWIEAGNTFFDAGNYQQAIEAYYKRIDEDREDDRAWYLMGCAYRAMGNPYESVEAWEKAFRLSREIPTWKNSNLIQTVLRHGPRGAILSMTRRTGGRR